MAIDYERLKVRKVVTTLTRFEIYDPGNAQFEPMLLPAGGSSSEKSVVTCRNLSPLEKLLVESWSNGNESD